MTEDRESRPSPVRAEDASVAEPHPASAEEDVSAVLRRAGWEQGHLVEVARGHFELGPSKDPSVRELQWHHEEAATSDRLVIASQTCDIVKRPDREPTVETLFAFETGNRDLLRNANRNSARYFLLDPDRGLVADFGRRVPLRKTALVGLTPKPGLAAEPRRKAWFATWLGRRYSRPAIPDDVVAAVVRPIQALVREMRDSRDPDLGALTWVNEIRFRRLHRPPFDVDLLLIADHPVPGEERIALARIVERISKRLQGGSGARLNSWDLASLEEVAYADVLETDEIALDDVTYAGEPLH